MKSPPICDVIEIYWVSMEDSLSCTFHETFNVDRSTDVPCTMEPIGSNFTKSKNSGGVSSTMNPFENESTYLPKTWHNNFYFKTLLAG